MTSTLRGALLEAAEGEQGVGLEYLLSTADMCATDSDDGGGDEDHEHSAVAWDESMQRERSKADERRARLGMSARLRRAEAEAARRTGAPPSGRMVAVRPRSAQGPVVALPTNERRKQRAPGRVTRRPASPAARPARRRRQRAARRRGGGEAGGETWEGIARRMVVVDSSGALEAVGTLGGAASDSECHSDGGGEAPAAPVVEPLHVMHNLDMLLSSLSCSAPAARPDSARWRPAEAARVATSGVPRVSSGLDCKERRGPIRVDGTASVPVLQRRPASRRVPRRTARGPHAVSLARLRPATPGDLLLRPGTPALPLPRPAAPRRRRAPATPTSAGGGGLDLSCSGRALGAEPEPPTMRERGFYEWS